MIVKDLLEHLKAGNPDAEAVFLDHFGKPIETTSLNFIFTKIEDGCFNTSDKLSANYLTINPPLEF